MRARTPDRRKRIPVDVWRVSRSKDRPQWVRDLCSRALSIYEDARAESRPHAWILKQRELRIFGHPQWRHLTAAERTEVSAYFAASSDLCWRRDLIWRLGPAAGPLPEDAQGVWGEDSELSRLARIPGALYGGHFWRGTDVAFNDYNCTNASALPPIANSKRSCCNVARAQGGIKCPVCYSMLQPAAAEVSTNG